MPFLAQAQSLQELIPAKQSFLIVLGENPSFDQVASALALLFGLRDQRKEAAVVAPLELTEQMQVLSGAEQVQAKLGNQNLSIKFPYNAEAVDKVSYHISDDNETFYLVIKPQKGHKPLPIEEVSFDYTGVDVDMVILIGVHQLESLGHLYEGFEELFEQTAIVSMHTFETEVGNIKLDVTDQVCFSQAMGQLLSLLQLPIFEAAATNILAGIDTATDGLSSPLVKADTFEMVATMMRAGGRRIKLPSVSSASTVSKTSNTTSKKKKKSKDNNVFAQSLQNNKPEAVPEPVVELKN